MGGEQEFVLRLAAVQIFAIAEMPVFETGFDNDLVGLVSQAFELPVRQAKAPVLNIV
jgi:hypothetical protein